MEIEIQMRCGKSVIVDLSETSLVFNPAERILRFSSMVGVSTRIDLAEIDVICEALPRQENRC